MQDALKYLQPSVVARLATMELRARCVVEGFISGLHKSPFHGFSVEFSEHRQYMPGDELKKVDWKLYAKTERFYIKQYEEETNVKTSLILDASRSMAFQSKGSITKFAYASYTAAALAYLMMQQRDAVGLTLVDEAVRLTMPPRATKPYLRAILHELESAAPGKGTGIGATLHSVAEQMHRRGLVIILSDFFDDPAQVTSALKHLRHNGHDVLVMQILDPMERTFAFGEDAVFEDMETGEKMTTQPWHIQHAYRESMNEFLHAFQKQCRENEIDYVLLDTDMTFETALVQYLTKRRRYG